MLQKIFKHTPTFSNSAHFTTQVTPKKSITDIEEAGKYCQNLVKKHDFYSFVVGLHFPLSLQNYYYGIGAFMLEMAKLPHASKERTVCHIRSAWWDKYLQALEKGEQAREPIGACIKEALTKTNINQKLLYRMLYYQMYFMEQNGMQYIRDLEIMAENTRSLQLFLGLHLLQIDSKDAYMAASHMGRCAGLCHIIALLPYYFQQQVMIIPEELLTKHGTSYSYLWDQTGAGKPDEKMFDIILELASYAKKHLELSRSYKDKLPKNANRALLIGIWCEHFLNLLEECNFNIFEPTLHKLSYLKLPRRIGTAAKKGNY